MNFEDKVKSMTAKEIIMNMVEALNNPSINVDMRDFGRYDEDGICFGCAATNTICRISGVIFNQTNIETYGRADSLNVDRDFMDNFEYSINQLRSGDLEFYNQFARRGGFAVITNPENLKLPILTTDSYLENLQPYVYLANSQPE